MKKFKAAKNDGIGIVSMIVGANGIVTTPKNDGNGIVSTIFLAIGIVSTAKNDGILF